MIRLPNTSGIIAILCFIAILLLTSCGRRNCACTKKDCDCIERVMEIRLKQGIEPGDFTSYDINRMRLIITDKNFLPEDSVDLEFQTINGQDDYNRRIRIDKFTFSPGSHLQNRHLLVNFIELHRTDTIRDINYSVYSLTRLCNTCVSCPDEYYTCREYKDISMNYKGNTLNTDYVLIRK